MTREDLYSTFIARFQEGEAIKASSNDLQEVESQLQILLPYSYRNFLSTYGAVKTPSISNLIFENEAEMWDVLSFCAVSELVENARLEVSAGLPGDFFSFANDSMGNLFCFRRSQLKSPSDDASVWFFDHEYCKTKELFDSFDSWLSGFVKLEPSST